MSDLGNLKKNESWRTNIKKFLFMERKPEALQNNTTITESQRYSLDIDEELKNIIKEKKNHKRVQINDYSLETENKRQLSTIETEIKNKHKMNRLEINSNDTVCEELDKWQKTADKSFEALEKMCEKTVSDPNSTLFKYFNGEDEEEEKRNNIPVWQKTSDESFEALEKMCDKIASDPNSTLFQYLHSDCKDHVLAEAKKRSMEGKVNSVHDKEDSLLMKLNNCTLLDDVEAPSRLWETTICGDTVFQTSPIKMIRLLRPSTIIEEAPDESCSSDVSSQSSSKDATKTSTEAAENDVSSSIYDTAHNSTAGSGRTDTSNQCRKQELEIIDVDHILFSALAKSQKQEENNENLIIPFLEVMDATIVRTPTIKIDKNKENNNNASDISINLIDLEKTFEPLHNSPHSSSLEDPIDSDEAVKNNLNVENLLENNENKSNLCDFLDDSVIEIFSDDEEEEEKVKDNVDFDKEQILNDNIKLEMDSKSSYSFNHSSFSLNESPEDDKENRSETRTPTDKSIQFNDTMEEVEYMLKKGMEYLTAEAASKQTPEKASMKDHVSKTQTNSSITHKKPCHDLSSSALKVCTPPLNNVSSSKIQNSSSKRFDIDIRPFPKLDIFSKPLVHVRHKELVNSKQQKFSHIVSPIGTYMKKTAKTPLMSSINSRNADYFNSTAILELENESRLYQPQSIINGEKPTGLGSKLPGLISDMKRPLPKKAYISSDLKHIVDERTPVTIPGGNKIQKYLENAIMPAVLRHDGKFKMPGTNMNYKVNTSSSAVPSKLPLKASDTNSTVTTKSSHIPRRNNASLADLSLMSGDVSMYTIMDAQKF